MKKVISVAVASALFGGVGANAHVPEDEWNQFKAQFAAMSQRLNQLEAENKALREAGAGGITVEDLNATNAKVAALEKQNSSISWAEKIKWKGDFRYRHEDIQQDGRDDRDRQRIRARAALIAKPTDTNEIGLGIATGGDDPVSTNQTLGGGGSTKDVRLDMAYFKWTGIEDFYLQAGKYKNPWYKEQKSGLIWDGDFRPEGMTAGWSNDMFFATASYVHIESDARNDDESIWGLQVGAKVPLGDTFSLSASAGYLDIPTEGRTAVYDDDFFGNSTVIENGEEVFQFDYNVYNVSLGLNFNLFDMPVVVYGDYVENDDADDLETGYLAGVKLGKAKKQGSWQVQYQYEDLEADAVLGVWTDSDFMGGGTDGEGHKFSAKYMLNNKWYLGATYFDGNTGVDLGDDDDYQRLQLDTGFKY